MMPLLLGSFLVLIFLFLAALHGYWAFGGTWGADAVIPVKADGSTTFRPRPFETAVVALGLGAVAGFIAIQASLAPGRASLPHWLAGYGLYVLSALFLLRALGDGRYVGFFQRLRHTRFGRMDIRYYSPLCLLIAVSLLILQRIVPAG